MGFHPGVNSRNHWSFGDKPYWDVVNGMVKDPIQCLWYKPPVTKLPIRNITNYNSCSPQIKHILEKNKKVPNIHLLGSMFWHFKKLSNKSCLASVCIIEINHVCIESSHFQSSNDFFQHHRRHDTVVPAQNRASMVPLSTTASKLSFWKVCMGVSAIRPRAPRDRSREFMM